MSWIEGAEEKLAGRAKQIMIVGIVILAGFAIGYATLKDPMIPIRILKAPFDAVKIGIGAAGDASKMGASAGRLGGKLASFGLPIIVIGGVAYYFMNK